MEAIFLVCGAGGPQLKRNPLGGNPYMVPEPDILVRHLIDLERDFGLPDGFLINLPKDSDWSFTIKLYSLIEASLTQALVAEFGRPALDGLLASMNMMGRHSKLAYADALALLPKQQSDFVKRLTKIRNDLVHNVGALTFTFPAYIAALSTGERSNTLNELLFFAGGPDGKAGELFATHPREAVWLHALGVITYLVGRKAKAHLNAQIREHYRNVAEQVLGPLKELQ